MTQQPQNNGPSFVQKIEHAQWLMRFPALTVMVFLRRDLGYRLVSPLHLTAITVLVAFVALFAQAHNRAVNVDDLLLFLLVAFVLGICQRLHRWWQMNRGVCQHSYYLGTSPFDSRRLPKAWRRNRRVARFADPILCTLIGFILLEDSPALGLWLVFAGVCLRGFEDVVHRKERNLALDTVDGLIVSEIQGRTVEKFEKPPVARQQQPTIGIPTGLAPDVKQNMKRRKAK